MFGQQLASDVQQYLERLEKQRQLKVGADEASAGLTMGGDALRVPFLDFATATPKRHQTVVPGVGTLHDCCEHSPLFSAVARRLLFNSLVPAQLKGRDFGGDHTAKLEFLAPELVRAVARLRFKECAPADVVPQRNAYYSVLNTFQALHRSEAFRQLVHFVRDFAQLLKTSFRASSLTETTGPPKKRAKVDVATHGRTYGTLELFQKMILMHATYFLAAVLLGDHAEQVNTFLRLVFEIPLFSDAAVRHFRQRATVFLVPRRHGKTWFLVPLIALSLASFRGIKIGYTAHIRKATEPVFEEIDACLRGWFGSARVDHVKGETISFSFPDGSRSTIVFASSHNTNVSPLFFRMALPRGPGSTRPTPTHPHTHTTRRGRKVCPVGTDFYSGSLEEARATARATVGQLVANRRLMYEEKTHRRHPALVGGMLSAPHHPPTTSCRRSVMQGRRGACSRVTVSTGWPKRSGHRLASPWTARVHWAILAHRHGATQGQDSVTTEESHSALAESMWGGGAQDSQPPGWLVILARSHPRWRALLPGGQSDPRSLSMAQQ